MLVGMSSNPFLVDCFNVTRKNVSDDSGSWVTVGEKLSAGAMGYGTRYRNPLMLNRYVDVSDAAHRWYVANNDKIGKFLTKNYIKNALMKPFGFFDSAEIEAQTIDKNNDLIAFLEEIGFDSWFNKAAMNQLIHGWQVTIPDVSTDENGLILSMDFSKVYGEHETHYNNKMCFRYANMADVQNRDYEISEGAELPRIKINQILGYRGTWLPKLPLFRNQQVLNQEKIDADSSEVFHTANGNWNYGFGDSVFEGVWDSIIKLAEESENNHFRQGIWAFALLNPNLRANATKAREWVQRALYALNNKQLFADFPYIDDEQKIVPGIPSLNFRNIVQDGQPSSTRTAGLFSDMSSEWANLTLETGYTIRRLTGHPGGALAAADVDSQSDLVNDIARFYPLIRYLIKPFLKLLQYYVNQSAFASELGWFLAIDFDQIIIKTHWQMEMEKQILAGVGETQEARRTTSTGNPADTPKDKQGSKEDIEEIQKTKKRCPAGYEKNDQGDCEKRENSVEFFIEDYDFIETRDVQIEKIKMVKPCQLEEKSVQHFIEVLKDPGQDLDPILITDNYELLDGNHRLTAYKRLFHYWIPAKVYKRKSQSPALLTDDSGYIEGIETELYRINESSDLKPDILQQSIKSFLNTETKESWIKCCIEKHGPNGDNSMTKDQCIAAAYKKFRQNELQAEIGRLNEFMFYSGARFRIMPDAEFELIRENLSMPMFPAASSTVKGIGLYEDELLVQFHDSGGTYAYDLGSEEQAYDYFDRMTKSTSKGGFVWDELRGKQMGPAWGSGKPTPGGTSASKVPYDKKGRSPVQKIGGYKEFEKEAAELREFKMEPVPKFTGQNAPDVLSSQELGEERAYYPHPPGEPDFYQESHGFGYPKKPSEVAPSEFKGTPERTGEKGRPRKGLTGFQQQKKSYGEGQEMLFQVDLKEKLDVAQQKSAGQPKSPVIPMTNPLSQGPLGQTEVQQLPSDEERQKSFAELGELFKKRKQNASEIELKFGIVPNSETQYYGIQSDQKLNELDKNAPECLMNPMKYFFNGVGKAAKYLHKSNTQIYEDLYKGNEVVRYNKIKSEELITENHPKYGKLLKDDPDNWYVLCNGFSRTNPFHYLVNGRVQTEFQCELDIIQNVGLVVPLGIYHDLEKGDTKLPEWQIVGQYRVLEYDKDSGIDVAMRKTNKAAVKAFFENLGADDWITPMYEKAMEDIKNGKKPKLPNISTAYKARVVYDKSHRVNLQKDFVLDSVSYVEKANCSEPFCTADLVRVNSASRSCIQEKIPIAAAMLDEQGKEYDMDTLVEMALTLCRGKKK